MQTKRKVDVTIRLFAMVCVLFFFQSTLAFAGVMLPMEEIPSLDRRGFHFGVSSNKSSYKRHEPIIVTYWLENQSSEPQNYSPSDDRVPLEVYEVSGKPVPRCNYRPRGSRIRLVHRGQLLSEYDLIPPSAIAFKQSVDLVEDFGKGTDQCLCMPAGTFFVTCPEVNSDTCWIAVEEPTSVNEREAVALFDMALSRTLRVWINTHPQNEWSVCDLAKLRLLTQILSQNRHIYFGRRVSRLLFGLAVSIKVDCPSRLADSDVQELDRLAHYYLVDYPYDYHVRFAISYLDESTLSPDDAQLILDWWLKQKRGESDSSYMSENLKAKLQRIEQRFK